ncbi:hypothetical protein AB6A40_011155 [Gnathostoma spinigerum]|uniref:USP domain-containing protein n=1 Tax=Gnathostoma spinigerum TaxID=75299 RepID=A0ABD6F2H0_9BILA
MMASSATSAWEVLKQSSSNESTLGSADIITLDSLLKQEITFERSNDEIYRLTPEAAKNVVLLKPKADVIEEQLLSEAEGEDIPSTSSISSSDSLKSCSTLSSSSTLPKSDGLRMIQMAYSSPLSPTVSPSTSSSSKSDIIVSKRIKIKLHSSQSDVIRSHRDVASRSPSSSTVSSPTPSLTSASTSRSSPSTIRSGSSETTQSIQIFGPQIPRQLQSCSPSDLSKAQTSSTILTYNAASCNSISMNGVAKSRTESLSLPSTSRVKINGSMNGSLKIGLPQKSLLNGVVRITRKRLLSDRGEIEAKFPMIDRRNFVMNWQGCHLLQQRPAGRNAGVGLYNQSNDCFLNAVLQTIVHTAPLARYVAEQHSQNSCTFSV